MNEEEAEVIVQMYSPSFIKSVVVLEKHRFLMTSFSLFIHNNTQIDDCADLSKVGYQARAVAFIRRKTRLGKDYFELTYRLGYLELLATSDFFGSVDGESFPFLGSSIQEFPVAIKEAYKTVSASAIFIPKIQKPYTCKNRILNQHYKQHSKNNWGFHSKKYDDQGFAPANPLCFSSRHTPYPERDVALTCRFFV
ncbi:hypothetical protein RMATCC62417_11506 [Rhizopus microsporus]|nr:hypothetical protein RMATCC62417_11506 [Rhizopus microsporus]